MGLDASKPVFGGFRTIKAQTSAYVIRCLESIIYRLATSEMSIFYLVYVAEQACLNIFSQPLRQIFCVAAHIKAGHYQPTGETPSQSCCWADGDLQSMLAGQNFIT